MLIHHLSYSSLDSLKMKRNRFFKFLCQIWKSKWNYLNDGIKPRKWCKTNRRHSNKNLVNWKDPRSLTPCHIGLFRTHFISLFIIFAYIRNLHRFHSKRMCIVRKRNCACCTQCICTHPPTMESFAKSEQKMWIEKNPQCAVQQHSSDSTMKVQLPHEWMPSSAVFAWPKKNEMKWRWNKNSHAHL